MRQWLYLLEERRSRLMESLAAARRMRDEADNRILSSIDSQRDTADQEVAIREAMISNIDALIEQLSILGTNGAYDGIVTVGRRVTLQYADGEKGKFLLVDKLGGVDLDDCQTLSTASPVGKAVLGAQLGESVSLPGKEIEIHVVAVD